MQLLYVVSSGFGIPAASLRCLLLEVESSRRLVLRPSLTSAIPGWPPTLHSVTIGPASIAAVWYLALTAGRWRIDKRDNTVVGQHVSGRQSCIVQGACHVQSIDRDIKGTHERSPRTSVTSHFSVEACGNKERILRDLTGGNNGPRLWLEQSVVFLNHYSDAIMGTVASQITSLTIGYTTVYSDADQSKHQSSASLAFVWGIHRGPVNSPHKWPVPRKMFSFDDVIMCDAASIKTAKIM